MKKAKPSAKTVPQKGKTTVTARGASKKSAVELDKKFVPVSKDVAKQIMDILCKRYPDAQCELNFAT
ncbi:MAG: hypothetical protein ACRD3W_19260, partial [Terriglobales bacterium]